jgi:hypothetical protein
MQKKKIEEALPFTIAALSAAAHSVQNHRHIIGNFSFSHVATTTITTKHACK